MAYQCRYINAVNRELSFGGVALRSKVFSYLFLILIGWMTTWQLRGSFLTELHRFMNSNPGPSSLTFGSNGALYGTCQGSGDYGYGYVFRLESDGSVTPLVSF